MIDFIPSNLPTFKSPSQNRGFFVSLFQFLVLFVFFFTVSLTVVMFPTLTVRVGYLLGLGESSPLTASLPAVANRPAGEFLALLAEEREIPLDDRLIIPKIQVEVPVIYSQSADNTAIMKDLKSGVIHYPGTAYPGQRGNVFITGHSSFYWWSGGKYNQVFANLDKLERGDLVYLYRGGREFVYQVYDEFIVKPTQTEVLNPTPDPVLTLMTCVPLGTNLKRLIIRSRLITAPLSVQPGERFEKLPEILPLQ